MGLHGYRFGKVLGLQIKLQVIKKHTVCSSESCVTMEPRGWQAGHTAHKSLQNSGRDSQARAGCPELIANVVSC